MNLRKMLETIRAYRAGAPSATWRYLGIPDPAAAGVLPSGGSILADVLYKRKATA